MIQEEFDIALKKFKNGDVNTFYSSDNVLPDKYFAYYTKAEWLDFLENFMSDYDKKAYEDGGGKELEEKFSGKWGVWMPPKMAAYASSSRFIYELLKDNGVVFEQKLPTSIPRSISNMDGYLPSKEIFIEAKCHEIYSSPTPKYKLAYKKFYDGLLEFGFKYLPAAEKNDASISFSLNGVLIDQFDIKQTISHLLGIANACKRGVDIRDYTTENSSKHRISCCPKFVYLLFNPMVLKDYLPQGAYDAIINHYNSEKEFITNNVSFLKTIFRYSLKYVGVNDDKIDMLSSGFKVIVADQNNIMSIIEDN